MGEDVSDMATTTSQLQAKLLALTGGKVDIMLDANTFKNSTQILREMAEAWEDMNDIQRASALELMGGKRQANVLSALIQNFDTVENVIKTSANSAGSALKENERYLDSIQGKIDQFNNAMQAMWSNTLDSDVVKGFVALGTEIIKIIDKIGLLNTALIALATISMIKNKMGPIAFLGGISDIIRDVVGKVGVFIGSLTGMTAATSAYTAETLAASVANGTLSASEAASIASKNGLALATTNLTATETAEMLMKAGIAKADALAMVAKLGLTSSTKALSLADIQAAVSSGALTAAQGSQIASALGLTVANKGLTASLIGLWTALWPILAVMAGVAVIWGVVKAFDAAIVTTEELQEELDGLKAELQDTRSELESVNSELKTMDERMSELLAKDKLTFEEQEELNRLRESNDELERRKNILKEEEKYKSKIAGQKAAEVVNSIKSKKEWWEEDRFLGWFIKNEQQEYDINDALQSYQNLKDRQSTQQDSKKLAVGIQDQIDEYDSVISDYIFEISDALKDVEYGDSDESDVALDYLAELQDRYNILRGSESAKTNAIKGIFNKDEFTETKTAIDGYVDALSNGDKSATKSIEKIINSNKNLVEDLETRGLKAQDAIDYFTKLGSEANYATLEGKIAEVSKAATNFESLLKGGLFKVDDVDTGLSGLFDEEGKIIQRKLSQVFNDTSDQTRDDITHLLEGSYEQIKNGTVDVERLLTGFGLKTAQQVIGIQNKLLGDQNIELFPNLKDEINGIIDTFEEFSKAVGGVVDALDTLEQARAEEAYSGSVSIETLENLMKYTDDYAQLIEIDETGALTVAANAEEILIGKRIKKIKTDAAAAVQTAQTNLEQAKYNAKAVNETGPVQDALTSATDALAGSWAYLGSLIGDVTDGNFSGMFDRASDAYKKSTTGREKKRAQVNVSVEDAQEALDKAIYQQKIANALTSDNVKSKYSSDEASGGSDSPEDVKDDSFQREMDYWENLIKVNQAKYEQIQSEIDLLEARGIRAGADYYREQIKIEQERSQLLAKQQAQAKKRMNDLVAAGKEGSEEYWEAAHMYNDLANEIDGVTLSIQEHRNKIIEASHGFVDDVQDIYNTLSEAQKEYDASGHISADTLQSLLELEPKYLDLLVDENGELNLNEQALKDLAKARIEDLKIKQKQSILEEAFRLASSGTTQAIIDQIAVMEYAEQVSDNWIESQLSRIRTMMYQRVAQGEFTKEVANEFINGLVNQLNATDAAFGAIDVDNLFSSGEADEKFQSTMDYWENRIQANRAKFEQIQNEIDLIESKGQKADVSYYQKQIELEQEHKWLLEQQKAAAEEQLKTLKEGSDEWWEIAHQLNDIESDLDGVTASIVDLQDAMGELDAYRFEEFGTRLNNLTDKLSTIRDLIAPNGEEDWFDDEGNWTDKGVGVLGTYINDLEFFKQGYKKTMDELAKYESPYAGNEEYYAGLGIHSEQELYDKTEDLISQQGNYAKSINDTEQSIVGMYESSIDAVEEYTQTLIEGYNDYISSVKEALDAERDLYDFKKNVQKQSKDIATIERRIASLSGSTNASDIAERRKLEAELYEGRESLNDTYYDHAKNAQSEALDSEANAYQETMTTMVQGMRDSLTEATSNMESFLNYVTVVVSRNANTVLKQYQETGLLLTPELTNPWEKAKEAVGNYSGNALELMNQWSADGYFDVFKEKVGDGLSSPWNTGQNAANAFSTGVDGVMASVVESIETNVISAKVTLEDLFSQINDTDIQMSNVAKKVNNTISGLNQQVGALQTNLQNVTSDVQGTTNQYTPPVEDGSNESYQDTTTPGGLTSLKPSNTTLKAAALREAQAYVDKKGFSEGDKQRWGQDLAFRPLLQNLMKYGGSINDLKGKVYKQDVYTGAISDKKYTVTGLNSISWGNDDFTVNLDGKSYKTATDESVTVTSSRESQLNKLIDIKKTGRLAMLDRRLYVVDTDKKWKIVSAPGSSRALEMAYLNKLNGYAKGTMATSEDQWAITDEPQFGDELTMYATPEGTLSFMRAGSTVVPADITANLVEWGKLNPDMLNVDGTPNINMISNAVNKPELNITFDSLVKAENITEETLPAVRKLVTQELNRFTRELNYALKGKGAR